MKAHRGACLPIHAQRGVPSPGAWNCGRPGWELVGLRSGPVPQLTEFGTERVGLGASCREQPRLGVQVDDILSCTLTPQALAAHVLLSLHSVGAFVKTWLPFVLLLGIILTVSLVFNLR